MSFRTRQVYLFLSLVALASGLAAGVIMFAIEVWG